MIFFDEKKHEYRLFDAINGPICVSATTFISLFKGEFQSDYWSLYTAFRKAKGMYSPIREEDDVLKKQFAKWLIIKFKHDFKALDNQPIEQAKAIIIYYAHQCGITKEELEMYQQMALHEWKGISTKAQIKGTTFHNSQENLVYQNDGKEFEGVYSKLINQTEDLTKLCDPNKVVIAPELRMYNERYMISGTADEVVFYPDRTFSISDWKTSRKIDRTSKSKMKFPVDYLENTNENHYYLQISLYAWMLEQFNYKCKNLKFIHVILEEDGITIKDQIEYHTPFLKLEIENMLNYYDKNKEELLKKIKK